MKNICFLISFYYLIIFTFGRFSTRSYGGNESNLKTEIPLQHKKDNIVEKHFDIDGCYVFTEKHLRLKEEINLSTDSIVCNLSNIENSLNTLNENLLILNAE